MGTLESLQALAENTALLKEPFPTEKSSPAAQQNTRMKVLLGLTVLAISLAWCHGACQIKEHVIVTEDGQPIPPTHCTDDYNGSKYPIGSKWNTAECLECSCGADGMVCCHRYGGPVSVPGCDAVVDPETCEYKFYKAGDPTKPCQPKETILDISISPE